MKHLDFIVWFLGWPLAVSLWELMEVQERKIKGLPFEDKEGPLTAFVYFFFITWFVFAIALW
jgi:hypothetical protein